MKAAPHVQVQLAEGAESGLANIVEQYLRQDLEEFESKRRQAARLRGRLALTATDHDTTVTLGFGGRKIEIWDGERPPLDASIAGPHLRLTKLLTGEVHPLWEHLRGRLRVRSSLRRPFLPLQVHSLMKLPSEGRSNGIPCLRIAMVGGAVALVLLALRGLSRWCQQRGPCGCSRSEEG